MSSVGLSGLSNISTDALQTRYQKALKQINKLIQINRQLKESSAQKDQEISQLSCQLQKQQQTVRELDQQNDIIESKYMELEGHYRQVQSYCKQLQEKLQLNNSGSHQYDKKLREQEMRFHQQLQSKALKYNELAREAELLHHGYQQNLTTRQAHQERIKILQEDNYLLRQKVTKIQKDNQSLTGDLKTNNNDDLKKRLEFANSTIQMLMRQCSDLRNRQIDFQVSQQRQKVERYLGFSLINDSRQNEAVKKLIKEYRKKIHGVQADKKQLQSKYKHLKHKLNASASENCQIKVQKLEKLTERQQIEIAKLIQTYDKQINYMFKQNMKLKQRLYQLSHRFKQKSMDLEEKEKMLSELKVSTQRLSFENQSLKKLNHSLIQAKSIVFRELGYMRKDFSHSQSFTKLEKRQSQQKLAEAKQKISLQTVETPNTGIYNLQEKVRSISKASDQTSLKGVSGKYPIYKQGDFRFIQSVNIINGYNVNLGENARHLKK